MVCGAKCIHTCVIQQTRRDILQLIRKAGGGLCSKIYLLCYAVLLLLCSTNAPIMLKLCIARVRKIMHQYYVILYLAFFEHQCAAVHLLLPSASALTPTVRGLEVG